MTIKFIKDMPDPRPNRTKVFKSGLVMSFHSSFAKEAIKQGYAVESGEKTDSFKELEKISKKSK